MTIIQNHAQTNSDKPKILISALIGVVITLSIGGIFIYNQKVNLSHEIDSVKITLRDAEVKNAELKNSVYGMLDQQKLQSLVTNQALVIDKNPSYVKNQVNSGAVLSVNQ